MGFFDGFVNNWNDAWNNVGQMFKISGDHFAKGNIMGGLTEGVNASLGAIGNAITLGGANYVGNQFKDKASMDENGNVKIDGNDPLCRFAEWHIGGMVDTELMMQDAESRGDLAMANTIGGVDLAFTALDVTTGTGLLSSTGIVKGITKGIGKLTAKNAAKTAAKETTKATVKTVAKEAAEEAVEGTAKAAVKTAAKETAKITVKTAAKEGAEEVVEGTAKNTAKSIFKTMTKEHGIAALKEGAKKSAKETTKVVVKKSLAQKTKSALLKGGVAIGIHSLSGADAGKAIKDYQADGVMGVVKGAVQRTSSAVLDLGKSCVESAAQATGGALNAILPMGKFHDWLRSHPNIAKVYNACKAAGYAVGKSFGNMDLVAYPVAFTKKMLDFGHKYNGVGVKEIAEDFKSNANPEGQSLAQLYKTRYDQLNRELGIETNTSESESSQSYEIEPA